MGKLITFWILVIVCVVGLTDIAEAADFGVITRRAQISHQDEVIGTLEKGTKLLILEEDAERYRIQTVHEDIQIRGWVLKSDLVLLEIQRTIQSGISTEYEKNRMWNKIADPSGNLPRHSPLINEEYNLDKKTYSFSNKWDQMWEENDNGLRATFGSTSKKRLYQLQEVKVTQKLNQLDNLEFHYFGEKSLDADRDYAVFTVDHKKATNPNFHTFYSIAPVFLKQDIDMEFGAGFELNKNKNWQASLFVLDVFNNLVYSWEEDEEGKAQKYVRQPWGIKFDSEWEFNPKTRGHFFGLGESKWEQDVDYSSDDDLSYVTKGSNAYWGFSVERDLSDNSALGLKYMGEEEKRSKKHHASTNSGLDYNYQLSINSIELYFLHALSERARIEISGKYLQDLEEKDYPHDKDSNYEYNKSNLLPGIIWQLDASEDITLELGYYRDDAKERWNYHYNSSLDNTKQGKENRLQIGVEYRYKPSVLFKFKTALDLDSHEQLYDKGNFQVMILW